MTGERRRAATGASGVARVEGPPEAYVDEVAQYVRRLAVAGRGEDVRGRNLLALQVLELGYGNGWLSYAPNRDVARWLVMLLDLVGARRGIGPRARVTRTLDAFLADVTAAGLPNLARVTRDVTFAHLARALDWPLDAAAVLAPRLAVVSALWHLGFEGGTYRSQVHFEKNSQGKLVRRKISDTLDGPWADALLAVVGDRKPTATHVLAALPPSFEVVAGQVEGALERVDEPLEAVPFAVFYSLVTDAARSGRRWEPPARYVQGSAYTRLDFERAAGRFSKGSRSRRRRYRYRRSLSLAELGLSSFFPRTVAVIDGWLAACQCSELWVETPEGEHAGGDDGWYELANGRHAAIRALQEEIHGSVSRVLTQGGGVGATEP